MCLGLIFAKLSKICGHDMIWVCLRRILKNLGRIAATARFEEAGIGLGKSSSKGKKSAVEFGQRIFPFMKRVSKKTKKKEGKLEKEPRPFSGNAKYDPAGCWDQLQNDKMLPYHAVIRKTACAKYDGCMSQGEMVRYDGNKFLIIQFSACTSKTYPWRDPLGNDMF